MEVSTPKTEGKLHHARSFPSVFGEDTSINQPNITTFPYHFINDNANERAGKGSTPSQMAKNCIKIMHSEVINAQNTYNRK